jgi:hypothetical protein
MRGGRNGPVDRLGHGRSLDAEASFRLRHCSLDVAGLDFPTQLVCWDVQAAFRVDVVAAFIDVSHLFSLGLGVDQKNTFFIIPIKVRFVNLNVQICLLRVRLDK